MAIWGVFGYFGAKMAVSFAILVVRMWNWVKFAAGNEHCLYSESRMGQTFLILDPLLQNIKSTKESGAQDRTDRGTLWRLV